MSFDGNNGPARLLREMSSGNNIKEYSSSGSSIITLLFLNKEIHLY